MPPEETTSLKRNRGKGKGKKRGDESERINGLQRRGRSERGSKRGEARVLGGVWILEDGRTAQAAFRVSTMLDQPAGPASGSSQWEQPVGAVDRRWDVYIRHG